MSQVILVVGGSGGIGSATTKYFSKQGVKTFLTYFNNEEAAKKIKDSLNNCETIKCDIRNENDVNAMVSKIIKTDLKIDVLINCVTSPLKLKIFDRMSTQECFEDLDVILHGGILMSRAVLPHMKERRAGTIVNLLSTVISGIPPVRMTSYVIAKYGLLGLTKCLASEVGRFNIKVLGLSPSFVETELLSSFPKKLIEIEKEKQEGKTLLQPEDIAHAIWHITQNTEKYPNGENIWIRTKKDILNMETVLESGNNQ